MPDRDPLDVVGAWFRDHVTLDGAPYTLDRDQIRAVIDDHHNTLVTARAGSGKTRVIVAKIAYLVAQRGVRLDEIVAFMFNRTAAAEVNQRIVSLRVDGQPLATESPIAVASTFHKFALDLVKSVSRPQIIDEPTQQRLIVQAFDAATVGQKFTPAARREQLQLTASFIARAGQKFGGPDGLAALASAIARASAPSPISSSAASAPTATLASASTSSGAAIDPLDAFHRRGLAAYRHYLAAITPPRTDFNQLMTRATALLSQSTPVLYRRQPLSILRFILIDEYQDFSQLFFALVEALRTQCPAAHLFAVGDDWQAINRFAGSDVDYFVNFDRYFPDDHAHIPLMTNYRSARRIVENANDFMLTHYDATAARAVPFSRDWGRVCRLSLAKLRFDPSDILEDGLGDARYQQALLDALCAGAARNAFDPASLIPAAKLLKQVVKIICREPGRPVMLLHRHNFTTTAGVTLPIFAQALTALLDRLGLMTPSDAAAKIRFMTIHKSKGLESDVVILLEIDQHLVFGQHPHVDFFGLFGDTRATERADQERLLYVALTRAKRHLYIITNDPKSPI